MKKFSLKKRIIKKSFYLKVSKSFVKFVEANDRLFLFQNELSYDIDDGEKDRDILVIITLFKKYMFLNDMLIDINS